MRSPQSRINGRRIAIENVAETAPAIIAACMTAVALMAFAVLLGAAAAAIPQIGTVLDQAEQLRGF